jgi:hypothetical protein
MKTFDIIIFHTGHIRKQNETAVSSAKKTILTLCVQNVMYVWALLRSETALPSIIKSSEFSIYMTAFYLRYLMYSISQHYFTPF